ncbi:MAG TPA: S8 family peptidase, partial [Gemmatimonadaceae bacterium]|nr:S8 family peptidase [Gemmatimonadaceae bacterium]
MAAKKKKVAARKRARATRPSAAKAPKPTMKTTAKPAAKSAATTAATKRAKAVDAILKPEATPEPSGAATIVYIHGIGNKPPASVLKGQWDQALFEFDLGERTRMAYWVDRERYPAPLEEVATGGDFADGTEEAPQGEVSPREARASWDPESEMGRMESHLAELVGAPNELTVPQKDADRLRELAGRMINEAPLTNEPVFAQLASELKGPEGSQVRRIQAQRYGASAVQAKVFGFLPKPMRQWLTRNMTKTFLRDVNDLFVDKTKGNLMRESMRERLRAGGGPFVVISHSQGTMIAYTVLMEPEFAGLDIPLFVTVGSPLGIDEVQDFIRDLTGQKKLVTPPNVRRWVNVCDPLDPVALDKDLSRDFGPNARGVKVQNHVKFNPDSLRHPHSGTGYLSMEEVRQPVRETVDTALFQPVARFKIAKDVVRSFADSAPDERHRILVQLEDFATTDLTRETALERIYDILGAKEEASTERQALEPEELHRYVALNLTRQEAEKLSSVAHSDKKFPVARIWKNSAKWAYLDRSIHTTQAFPAHNSYQAAGADVTWAVLDSGVNLAHPHFKDDTITRVFDCTDATQRRNKGPLVPLDLTTTAGRAAAADRFGHGAHVAGIIAGRHTADDRDGKARAMCGMAPDAKLVIYKVLDNNGSGEDSWIIKALDNIFETNERAGKVVIHGVNLSLGGEFDVEAFNCGHTPLCVELRRLWRQGVVVVLAAGNEGFASLSTSDGDSLQANMGMSIGDPANLEEAIVVGSVHKDSPHTYGTSFFSSRGPTADGRMKPDCVAPGERIFSVRSDAPNVGANATFEQLYTEMSGTSMAAPHVSGLIASFLSKRKEFMGRPDDMKRILLANCTDLDRQRNMQ